MTDSKKLPYFVAVLFARKDSHYHTIAGCDVWDIDRDARRWPGGAPVIAHPPCRAWGQLRHMAKPRDDEKALALFALEQVQRWGGVLEHPAKSSLWHACGLPEPGTTDKHGGITLPIFQSSWGHEADKATRLYIVGCSARNVPDMPLVMGRAAHIIGTSGRNRDGSRLKPGDQGYRPEVSKANREHTPPALAAWLVQLARSCKVNQ